MIKKLIYLPTDLIPGKIYQGINAGCLWKHDWDFIEQSWYRYTQKYLYANILLDNQALEKKFFFVSSDYKPHAEYAYLEENFNINSDYYIFSIKVIMENKIGYVFLDPEELKNIKELILNE